MAAHDPHPLRARAPGRALRGAVVGFGRIAERGHVPAYAAQPHEFAIVAVADACEARRQAARAALPGARVYASHDELLDAEQGQLDFVDVATPPSDHARIARAALGRGLHVLCEKPLATTPEDARSMAACAREARRVLYPCHNYKHAPVVQCLREVLDSGALGQVRLATLQTFRPTHARGVDEWRPDWRRERRISGGGVAMDHGSHTLYLAFDWLGGYPTSVTAKTWTTGPFDTEDDFACAMTFPSGMATAHLSWTAGVRKVIYTVHGDAGTVRVEDDDVEVTTRTGANDGAAETRRHRAASRWMDASHVDWFRSLFARFASAVRGDDFVGAETVTAVRCVETIAAAYASAGEGSRERVLPR